MSKHPGDPTPRSPESVLGDRNYRVVERKAIDSGVRVVLVVFHCGSETYWSTMFSIVAPELDAAWYEVRPHVETRVVYRRHTS